MQNTTKYSIASWDTTKSVTQLNKASWDTTKKCHVTKQKKSLVRTLMNINKSINKFKMAFKRLWLSNFYFSSGHLSNQTIVSMCANIRYLQQHFPYNLIWVQKHIRTLLIVTKFDSAAFVIWCCVPVTLKNGLARLIEAVAIYEMPKMTYWFTSINP